MEHRAIVALQAKSDSVRSDPDRLFAERDASVFFFDTTAEWHTRDCDDVPIRGDSRKRLTVSASFPTGPNNDVRYTVPRTAASRGTPPFVEVLPSEDPAGILPRGRHCIRTSGKVTSGTYPYGGFEAPLSWSTLLPSLPGQCRHDGQDSRSDSVRYRSSASKALYSAATNEILDEGPPSYQIISIIADFTVPADAFALALTLERTPEMVVTCEELSAHTRDFIMPFLWVKGPEFDRFEDALAADPTVDGTTVSDTFDGDRLYKVNSPDYASAKYRQYFTNSQAGCLVILSRGRS